jgi:hypothetical protein
MIRKLLEVLRNLHVVMPTPRIDWAQARERYNGEATPPNAPRLLHARVGRFALDHWER